MLRGVPRRGVLPRARAEGHRRGRGAAAAGARTRAGLGSGGTDRAGAGRGDAGVHVTSPCHQGWRLARGAVACPGADGCRA
eukprot:3440268-Pyramimonas_sp.AAC.1